MHLSTLITRHIKIGEFYFMSFSDGSAGKESACNVGDLGSIPGLGRSLEEGNGYPLQYSGLEKSMDCIVHGVAKGQTRLGDFHFSFFYEWISAAVCGCSLVAVHRLLIAVASTAAEHGTEACG